MAYLNEVSTMLKKRLGLDIYTIQGITYMIHKYLRHDVAELLYNGCKKDMLQLKYVRRHMISGRVLHREDIFANLAPSVCRSTMYGDDHTPLQIIRTHISIAERVKLRVLGEKKKHIIA
tara:strand:- start:196 stop:552 length:357 start_codon:yes stop_codon:yes gene_type:complete